MHIVCCGVGVIWNYVATFLVFESIRRLAVLEGCRYLVGPTGANSLFVDMIVWNFWILRLLYLVFSAPIESLDTCGSRRLLSLFLFGILAVLLLLDRLRVDILSSTSLYDGFLVAIFMLVSNLWSLWLLITLACAALDHLIVAGLLRIIASAWVKHWVPIEWCLIRLERLFRYSVIALSFLIL